MNSLNKATNKTITHGSRFLTANTNSKTRKNEPRIIKNKMEKVNIFLSSGNLTRISFFGAIPKVEKMLHRFLNLRQSFTLNNIDFFQKSKKIALASRTRMCMT